MVDLSGAQSERIAWTVPWDGIGICPTQRVRRLLSVDPSATKRGIPVGAARRDSTGAASGSWREGWQQDAGWLALVCAGIERRWPLRVAGRIRQDYAACVSTAAARLPFDHGCGLAQG